MEDRISVRLTGPAKIDGRWRKPGEDVAVTTDMARELVAAGVIAEGEAQAVSDLAPGMPGFDEAVHAMAKTLADAAVQAAVETATAELIADRDAYRARANDADAEVNRQAARILELEAELAVSEGRNGALFAEIEALKARNTEGGEASDAGQEAARSEEPATAPKNTRKKGAGAADQG
ncbi:hypothetical protein [Paracoccus pantotrophus]|uniref:hypothetical protein n=1 Tax=Paracoccus pantotrophus TaxID=82367 RepID=UPI00048BA247|nr:hypothetical protein [Paracoccus pantotrophus]